MRLFTKTSVSFLVLLLALNFTVNAQTDFKDKAMLWVQAAADQLNLGTADRQNLIISDAYTDASTNISFVYIQQRYQGIKVFNAINALAFKDGMLLSQTNRFAPKIEVYAANISSSVSPESAVGLAALHVQAGLPVNLSVLQNTLSTDNRIVFNGAGIAKEKITVEKYWVKRNNSDILDLAWNVNIDMLNTSDWWNVRVSAVNGTILEKNNWTVTDIWDHHAKNYEQNNLPVTVSNVISLNKDQLSPPTVTTASYNVVPYPIESPIHGALANEIDPWNKAGASNLVALNGWHYDGTTNYNFTRGNNSWAYRDPAATDVSQGSDTSSTAIPSLSFLRVPNFALAPTTLANRGVATTNLFYWSNITHDISYQYGFTEAAGNFQASNFGRGGAGNDMVLSEAQDGSGTNNANFATPPDGNSGRMQMYLFTTATPNIDGDLDNGVITHEYGHGISTRLTGGSANSSCLDNSEEGGEGWSDYNALMLTTNWATAVMADSIKSRPMGTYVEHQAVTGAGIRRHPYNYNMTVNPITYADMAASGEEHDIGEIWCSALWDMTWNIIGQQGAIGPNLYDTSNTGGNIIALKLVLMGMKLQPRMPGFLDARDAILKADSILYNNKFHCAIVRAFARRGMGVNAVQGSSNSTSDQVADFGVGGFNATQKVDTNQVVQNGNIIFTLTAQCRCTIPLNNYSIKDSLAAGLQYVSSSGGTVAGKIVTFGGLNFTTEYQTISKTVTAKMLTAYCGGDSSIKDNRDGSTVGGFTDSTIGTSPKWISSTAYAKSPTHSWFARDTTVVKNILLQSAPFTLLNDETLTFWHYYNLETGFDGGVVEISTNNGSTWADLDNLITQNGYTATISTLYASPIAGRRAFSGISATPTGTFKQTIIDLSSFVGQTVRIRFRMGSDNSTAAIGWFIDDIFLTGPGCGARNKFFVSNSANVSVDSSAAIFVKTAAGAPLPLTLLSFTASKLNKKVQFNWATTNEINTRSFEVEKSYNARDWNKIATVNAVNNNLTENKYLSYDDQPANGINYYRLKMIDRDGKFTYSDIRTIRYDRDAITISLQPNPADKSVAINFNTDKLNGVLSITDATGKSIWSKTLNAASGLTYMINTAVLQSGIYLVSFVNEERRFSSKLVVSH